MRKQVYKLRGGHKPLIPGELTDGQYEWIIRTLDNPPDYPPAFYRTKDQKTALNNYHTAKRFARHHLPELLI